MMPVLLDDAAWKAGTEGFGRLAEAMSCRVAQTLNGAYELTLTYPVTGALFRELAPERLILSSDAGREPQLFRIVRISKDLGGVVEVYGQHVAYELANYFWADLDDQMMTVAQWVAAAAQTVKLSYYVLPRDGRFENLSSDMTTYVSRPVGSGWFSMLRFLTEVADAAGAMLYCDNYDVSIRALPTAEDVPPLILGKGRSVLGLRCEDTLEEIATAVVFYQMLGTEPPYHTSVRRVVRNDDLESRLAFSRVVAVDSSKLFDDSSYPSDAALDAYAQGLLAERDPLRTLPVSLSVELLGADEQLQVLSLGAPVRIVNNSLNVSYLTRVVETSYDALTDRLTSVTLGTPAANAAVDIAKLQKGG